MKNFHSPLPLDAPYFVIGTDGAYGRPKPIRHWFKAKVSLALREDSYPLLVIGGGGSGRDQSLQSMLVQNIHQKSPFVFVRGSGDSPYLYWLLKTATEFECADSLRNINFDLTHPMAKHTFDPINPLVGDLQSFQALFGSVGPLLHELCLAEHQAGQLVDLALFKSYLDLENLQRLRDQAKYESAQEELDHYLISALGIAYQDGHSQKQAALHAKFMSKPWLFYHALEKSQLCSTEPDVDFKNPFKFDKYVCVTLPSLLDEHENFRLLSTLFACLISQSPGQRDRVRANPDVIFEGVFDHQSALAFPLKRLSGFNTVFTLQGCFDEDEPVDSFITQICSVARSIVFMKSECHAFPGSLKISAFNHGVSARSLSIRDIIGQSPGYCFAWGNLALIRKTKPYRLIGLLQAKLRYEGRDLR